MIQHIQEDKKSIPGLRIGAFLCASIEIELEKIIYTVIFGSL